MLVVVVVMLVGPICHVICGAKRRILNSYLACISYYHTTWLQAWPSPATFNISLLSTSLHSFYFLLGPKPLHDCASYFPFSPVLSVVNTSKSWNTYKQLKLNFFRRMSFQRWPGPKWCSWLLVRLATSTHLPQGFNFFLNNCTFCMLTLFVASVKIFSLKFPFVSRKLQPMITSDAGKALIQVKHIYFYRILEGKSKRSVEAIQKLKDELLLVLKLYNWQTSLRFLPFKVWARPAK